MMLWVEESQIPWARIQYAVETRGLGWALTNIMHPPVPARRKRRPGVSPRTKRRRDAMALRVVDLAQAYNASPMLDRDKKEDQVTAVGLRCLDRAINGESMDDMVQLSRIHAGVIYGVVSAEMADDFILRYEGKQ